MYQNNCNLFLELSFLATSWNYFTFIVDEDIDNSLKGEVSENPMIENEAIKVAYDEGTFTYTSISGVEVID